MRPVTDPNLDLPPVDLCRGTKPSQAAKLRPLSNVFEVRCECRDGAGGDRADPGDGERWFGLSEQFRGHCQVTFSRPNAA